ncbi:MAG: multidrug effflux MFS transporter [Pseudomonadota bacterium]|nr:multidrug effflux MFS transporter [Pseudomonadota bacterium]
MQIGFARAAITLGLLCAIGPFAIDMYLPAMPAIEADLSTSSAGVQMTLALYFVAFALAQMVYGPAADKWGRKPPLYAGLLLFLVATLGCALAPSIEWLVAARFVQGIGGASVMVIPRAIVRDMYTGSQATRMMAQIMLVISVSPMLAPLAGSGMIELAGWRSIFAAMAAATLLSLALTAFVLPETLVPARRERVDFAHLLRGSRVLLRDVTFVGLTFVGGFGMASFFVFLSAASFVYTGHYGLSPTGFSLAFAVNAIGFFSASQFAASIGERFGMARMVVAATSGFAFFVAVLLAISLVVQPPLVVLIVFLLLANTCLGLVIPTAMVMALDEHGDMAGLASSLGGTLQMLAGAVMIAFASPFHDGTPGPMIAAIAVCAFLACALAWLTLRRVQPTLAAG